MIKKMPFLIMTLALMNPLFAQTAEPSTSESEAVEAQTTPIEVMKQAVFSNDEAEINGALKQVLAEIKQAPEQYDLRIAASMGYLGKADLLRIDRQTGQVTGDVASSYRAKQAELGVSGLEHAEKAKALATSREEKSEAYRLAGELMVHRIDGPISGLRFGPTAKSDIEYAITLGPENWEARRAQGLMFLNNPPINGGDLNKALETFSLCAEKDHDRDVYHALLAQTWVKRGRPERAVLEIEKALIENPNNHLAQNLKKKLEAK